MNKTLLLIICLSLSACGSIPKPPDIELSAFSWRAKKFRGCKTESEACRDIPLSDPTMQGAQCLSPPDFKSYMSWIDELINLLQQKKMALMQMAETVE